MRVVALAVIVAAMVSGGQAPLSTNCDDVGAWTTTCTSSNSGSSIELGGTRGVGGGDSRDESTREDASEDVGTEPQPPASAPQCTVSVAEGRLCRGNYDVAGLPDVTLSDLASFVPARPSLSGEPAGIGVVGMSTNVVAAASEQIIPGRLFEYDVRVRFTPAAYRFAYGDGTSTTTPTGGASWAVLGQAEFTSTATSHVYRSRGTYTASVTVLYSAAVDFGSGAWRPVAGYVEATTGGYGIRVVEVHTALVDKTCLENPQGPGC